MKSVTLFLSVLTVFLFSACSSVKPYQRQYLSDPAMVLPSGVPGEVAQESFLSKTGEHCSSKGSTSGNGACLACGP